MKILVTESQIEKLVSNYLDSQNWKVWDQGDNEFNIGEGKNIPDIFKYRIQYSSTIPDHSFDVLYVNESIIHLVNKLFSMDSIDSRKLIIDWFNKKYDKNLKVDDVEWFGWEDEEDDDYLNEEIIKEQYDSSRLYPKQEILRLLKNAPIELRKIARKLPDIPCENDKGERTICTKIPETIHVYLTGRY